MAAFLFECLLQVPGGDGRWEVGGVGGEGRGRGGERRIILSLDFCGGARWVKNGFARNENF